MVRGVNTLDAIASDSKANNRHRVDAIKVLDGIATPPSQATAADRERFSIVINTDGETVTIDQPIKPNPPSIDAADDAPWKSIMDE